MFANNQYIFEDLSFFNESNGKDLKLQRGFSSDKYTQAFGENCFDNMFDFSDKKWNSYPNMYSNKKENKNNEDDNSSNLADTEEHITYPAEQIKENKEARKESKDTETDEQSLDSIKFNQRKVDELMNIINQPSTDMNALLSEVLTAGPTDPMVKRKRAVTKKTKSKRVRKSKEQIDMLTKEYEVNSDWSNEDIARIAAQLSLTKKQVYKWYWDQRISQGDIKPKNW